MNSRRTAKVAEVIREIASTTILFELRDPRIKNVTVTRTEVSNDLRHAKIYVSIMGDEKAQSLTMHGLRSSKGFLQSKIAAGVKTRYTPLVTFVLDEGLKHSLEATRILNEVLGDNKRVRDTQSGDSPGGTPDNTLDAHGADDQSSESRD
jgi:ribosome-binding factor A